MVEQEKSLHASHLDRGSVARRMTLTTEEPAIELTIPPKKEGEQDRLRVKALSPRGFWGRRTLDCKWRWWGPGTSWSFQSNEQIALAWFEWQESPDAGSRAIEPTFNSFDTLTLRSTAAGAQSASLVTDAALAMADAQHHERAAARVSHAQYGKSGSNGYSIPHEHLRTYAIGLQNKAVPAMEARRRLDSATDFYDAAALTWAAPLTDAAKHGRFEELARLLADGADVEDGTRSWPPMRFACAAGHLSCVKLLSAYGASREFRNPPPPPLPDGRRLIVVSGRRSCAEEIAGMNQYHEVAAYLRQTNGMTRLHHFASMDADHVRHLLQRGANINATGHVRSVGSLAGFTPLILAQAMRLRGEVAPGSAADVILSQPPHPFKCSCVQLCQGHRCINGPEARAERDAATERARAERDATTEREDIERMRARFVEKHRRPFKCVVCGRADFRSAAGLLTHEKFCEIVGL